MSRKKEKKKGVPYDTESPYGLVRQGSHLKPIYRKRGPLIYFIQMDIPLPENPTKIGHTRDLKPRYSGLVSSNPYPLRPLLALEYDNPYFGSDWKCRAAETRIKQIFEHKRMRGEWFDLTEEEIRETLQKEGITWNIIEAKTLLDEWLI